MKRKEIAEYLDQVGEAANHMELLAYVRDGDKDVISQDQFKAVIVGISIGIALGAGLCDGTYKPQNPVADATTAIGAALDFISGGNDD